jgi:hypothetical protein
MKTNIISIFDSLDDSEKSYMLRMLRGWESDKDKEFAKAILEDFLPQDINNIVARNKSSITGIIRELRAKMPYSIPLSVLHHVARLMLETIVLQP